MRILLLSCNTGEGHNSTAKAVMEVLEAQGVECRLQDVLACLSPRFSKFISSWHSRLYRYAPRLSDASYRAMEKAGSEQEETPIYEVLSLGAGKLWEMLLEGNFDAVICVHVFSGMMMTEVRRAWGVRIPCFFVATDYTCSPTVELCEMDGYFIPSQALAGEFTAAGLPEERLIPSGIPVRQVFYHQGSRCAARQALGLPEEGVIALVMCGSMGAGPMRKLALELSLRMPEGGMTVAICGKNERLLETLREEESPRLRVLGYTQEVAAYMDAADLMVTKPGGLSSTEAANKGLPMVFINAVGACESRNFDFFCRNGLAVGSDDAEDTVALAVELAHTPEDREEMRRRLAEMFTKNSAREIADRVLKAATAYRWSRTDGVLRIKSTEAGNPMDISKGGTAMSDHKETILNLARSFAGESQARTRYTVYANIARREGLEWIARIFEKTAHNEAVHAERFLMQLKGMGGCADNIDLAAGYPFQVGTTVENLAFAAAGEQHEHQDIYPGFAEMARREDCAEAARLWMQISRVEENHHRAFQTLWEQLSQGTLMEKETPVTWKCLDCGYVYESVRPCDPCPICGRPAGWQAGSMEENGKK
ncbi:MAG TPA: glycosyltransferase [Candidatus Faecousia intestinigallinarum]|nr:glycosyltransferase [Candidatus Faecousia intestinigallinarum]